MEGNGTPLADTIEPVRDLLLIRLEEQVITRVGEIIVPEAHQQRYRTASGIVIDRGPEAPPDYEPGTRVLFDRLAPTVLGPIDPSQAGGDLVALLESSDVRGFIPLELQEPAVAPA